MSHEYKMELYENLSELLLVLDEYSNNDYKCM